MTPLHPRSRNLLTVLALGLPTLGAHAQLVINDTLTGASSSYDWKSLNGACLTAGDGHGSIPACVGLAYYKDKTLVGGTSGRLPDAVGQGALRLTNGDTQADGDNGDAQTGAVVSNFTFPTNEGLQVTWTSVTYGGDNLNGTGADGMSFFLSDGSVPPSVGALGGSLGYSCSNTNFTYDGVVKGYIGIGIDEYGDFSNKKDNTSTGDPVEDVHPSRISVRGSGDTALSELHARYPAYYPSGLSDPHDYLHYNAREAVQRTCKTAMVWNYSGTTVDGVPDSTETTIPLDTNNYGIISMSDLPPTISLSNQEGVDKPKRGAAVPITYQLKITSDGYMTFSYAVNGGATTTVINDRKITESNGPLPASFRFGFSAGTGAGSNVHEITCFKAAPSDISGSSAGSNVQSAQVTGDTQVFLAYYHPVNWWGTLTANALAIVTTGGLEELTSSPVASWDASCTLTGGSCPSMTPTGGHAPSITALRPDRRVILTSDGHGTGTAFETASLTTAQATALAGSGSDASTTDDRVGFLRGVRKKEVASGGSLRTRTGILGDIVDSSPAWVAYPNYRYADLAKDKLHAGTTVADGSKYAKFQSDHYSRMSVVYVGANDGMLHGFRAGTYTPAAAAGGQPTLDKTYDDGQEVLAFMPAQVLSAIHNPDNPSVDFSNTHYSHNFQVDATPGTGDLYYGGAWHTWLVGGLGAGGHPDGAVGDTTSTFAAPTSSLFALDITDPRRFSEANAASIVIGDWSSSTLSCSGTPGCGGYMGQTLGTPLIRRLHDGTWGVIWGNGTNSANGHSGLFIMHVRISDGARSFQYIDAGAGPAGGIAQVAAADLDGDHITDYVYAGDTLGRLWRFDLTSSMSSSWSALELFQTPSTATVAGTAVAQPITAAPVVASVAATTAAGKPKLVVYFGTGRKLPLTVASGESYSAGTQSIYGIWDASMTGWNATTTDTQYAALGSPTLPIPVSKLQSQTVTAVTPIGTDGYDAEIRGRTVSNHAVCWADGTSSSPAHCASYQQMGARLDLPTANEQVIYNPTSSNGYALFNTTIPGAAGIVTCDGTPTTGWSMALSLTDGGRGSNPALLDGYSGVNLGGTGTPNMYVTNGMQAWLGTETVAGLFKGVHLTGAVGVGSRLTWTKLR